MRLAGGRRCLTSVVDPGTQRVPILLDTDIGSDIDDALSLIYLLAQPRCELVGITTVTGEPERRAMLADAICLAAGRANIPIHAGSALPCESPQRQTSAPQAQVLARWPHRKEFQADTAVDFLIETIRSRQGELILLGIGPLTNVAKAAIRDPNILHLLKAIVVMHGNFPKVSRYGASQVARPEWNARLDPHASAIVYGSGAKVYSVGLNVTTRCVVSADELRSRLRGSVFDIVRDMAEIWFREHEQVVLHDPLAAVCIFVPKLFRWRRAQIRVHVDGPFEGATDCRWGDSEGVHQIVVDVDVKGFMAHYFEVLARLTSSGTSSE